MEPYVIQVLNMSYQAGIIICIVLIMRQIFHWIRVPKRFSYMLWLIPFFRMLCPWTVESRFSFMPIRFMNRGIQGILNRTAVSESNAVQQALPYIPDMESGLNNPFAGETIPVTTVPAASAGSDAVWSWISLAGIIWLTGMFLILLFSVISYWRLKRNLSCSVCIKDNIYLTDYIETPFVLGVWKPRIYLPSGIQNREFRYVIAHEQVHIRRRDYLIKIAAFVIVSIHWFNPLAWVAFIYMGKDMELSCDEMVLKQFGPDCRTEYASVLLELTVGKHRLSGTPLAFGEGDTKGRVHNIMKYKKPITIVVVFAVLALLALAVGLLTLPKSEGNTPEPQGNILDSSEAANSSEQNKESEIEELENAAASDESVNKAQMDRELEEKNRISGGEDIDKKTMEEELMNQWKASDEMLNSGLYALAIKEDTLTASGGEITIHNHSEQEIQCGDYYYIDSWNGSEWIPAPCNDDVAFHDIAYSIQTEGTWEKSLDWNLLYGELEPGIYLLRVLISVPKDEGEYETVELGVHFTIE